MVFFQRKEYVIYSTHIEIRYVMFRTKLDAHRKKAVGFYFNHRVTKANIPGLRRRQNRRQNT